MLRVGRPPGSVRGAPQVKSASGRSVADVIAPEPLAAKVPEITFLFWVVKILTTCGGEAASDYLALGNRLVGGAVEAD